MTKIQAWIVGLSLILFLVIYLGFDTVPRAESDAGTRESTFLEPTSKEALLREARRTLSLDTLTILNDLEKQWLSSEGLDKAEIGKEISSIWFQKSNFALAGDYAREIAVIENTDEAWSIAGTTFAYGLGDVDERRRLFCLNGARESFENAISIDPDEMSHRLNLALCFVEIPPEDNPMQGIQMLLQLNQENPEYIPVILNLARLAIQTGQYDRALARLATAEELDPSNRQVICLLASAHQAAGNAEEALSYSQKCNR